MFDELFEGTPEDRYFDILFTANRNLVKDELINLIEKLAVCEILLEKHGVDSMEVADVKGYILDNQDRVDSVKNNIYMHSMTEIISKNE